MAVFEVGGGGRRGRFEVTASIGLIEIKEGAGFRGQSMSQIMISEF